MNKIVLTLGIVATVAPALAAQGGPSNPVFGQAQVQKLTAAQDKAVVGKGYYGQLYGYYGLYYSSLASQYGSYGLYNSNYSYYYSAYTYANYASSYYYDAYYYTMHNE
jgi:hypothetical protein